MPQNPNWAEKLFLRFNVKYRPRWVIYENILANCITKDTVWIDVGCGRNENVAYYGHMAKNALGIDAIDGQDRTDAPFLCADLHSIPLPSDYASLITLRLVVEHFKKVPEDFSEICRILRPDGQLLILTTNCLSPVIFIPRIFSYRLKSWIIQKTFGVDSHDVFQTYHQFNTPRKMMKGLPKMSLLRLEFLEQVPLNKVLLTLIFGLWYSIVKLSSLKYFRSNLLAIYQKTSIK